MNISIFDIFKIGIGPSSSHTLGPWFAAKDFINCLVEKLLSHDRSSMVLKDNTLVLPSIQVELTGSLAKTGRGHATDKGIILGLLNENPATIDPTSIDEKIKNIVTTSMLSSTSNKGIQYTFSFTPSKDIMFNTKKILSYHPNALIIFANVESEKDTAMTYYSIGGGFVEKEIAKDDIVIINATDTSKMHVPFNFNHAKELQHISDTKKMALSDIVRINETTWRDSEELDGYIRNIQDSMLESIYQGCHSKGVLPGGLSVRRRAYDMCKRLMQQKNNTQKEEIHDVSVHDTSNNDSKRETIISKWFENISDSKDFNNVIDWVICFALAVNETNAAFGRVVTAPTNGAAGVIPAVFAYFRFLQERKHVSFDQIRTFFLTASTIGALFKKNATISAAAGGCQAEIGVSSAMAAAALTSVSGASTEQMLMSAEIAMEHHLGLTCDPIRGLVQIPCIERNSMGAIKAITASQIALHSNPKNAIVHLDDVISTMWETAQSMSTKYKETAEAGLATNVKVKKHPLHISVNLPEC